MGNASSTRTNNQSSGGQPTLTEREHDGFVVIDTVNVQTEEARDPVVDSSYIDLSKLTAEQLMQLYRYSLETEQPAELQAEILRYFLMTYIALAANARVLTSLMHLELSISPQLFDLPLFQGGITVTWMHTITDPNFNFHDLFPESMPRDEREASMPEPNASVESILSHLDLHALRAPSSLQLPPAQDFRLGSQRFAWRNIGTFSQPRRALGLNTLPKANQSRAFGFRPGFEQ